MADDKLIVTSLAYGKSRQVVISIVLGVNYLTFEGGGGGDWFVQEFFFSLASGADNFFRTVHSFFS